jgi:tRNA modification GTPase
MEFQLDDTIAALGSAPGPALRAVVRVTGPAVRDVLAGLFVSDDPAGWEACRTAQRFPGNLQLNGGTIVCEAAVCLWPGSRSYTGAPLAEVHLIGSPPLVDALLQDLYARGARPARGGEFTLRAFLAGRIDLLQAEAVLGVIDAPDQEGLRAALSQLAGGISGRIADAHEQLLLDLADLEAGLDFVEEDIEFLERPQFTARLESIAALLLRLLDQAKDRLQSAARARVVLAGLPNAGKSTLFNALVGREAALVSAAQGTTRDYLSAVVTWHGHEIELIDTAGCDDAAEGIMAAAHAQRQDVLASADLVLWCTAADFSPTERARDREWRQLRDTTATPVVDVATKSDATVEVASGADVTVSALTGAGLGYLRALVAARIDSRREHAGELLGSTAARCRDSLSQALAAVRHAQRLAADGAGDELIAVEVREALDQLGSIVGRVTTDDLLDRIFSRFCIGK